GIRDRTVTGVQTCALPIYCSIINNTQNGLYQLSLANTKSFMLRIEKQGWKSIKEKHKNLMTLAMIELNDDGSYPLKSIDKVMARSEERRVGKESKCRI